MTRPTDTQASQARPPRSPLRRLLRILGLIAVVFVLAVGGSALYVRRLALQPPEWWSPLDPTNPQVDRAARLVENGITNQLHQLRPTTPSDNSAAAPASPVWTLVIKEEDANAWLAARLQDWLLNRNERLMWPANVSTPQVAFRDGEIRLGFEVSDGGKGQVFSSTLLPSIGDRGALWLRLAGISIGRFSLGAAGEAAGGLIESRLPPEMKENPDTANFIQALAGKRALTNEPVAKLSDGRKVRILRITPRAGEIELECRTDPR